ncbi:MAG: recombinase family protein [Planctomycetaceae bacterium]|nr:recombinase family protein [Planctomycetaceae bacterium]
MTTFRKNDVPEGLIDDFVSLEAICPGDSGLRTMNCGLYACRPTKRQVGSQHKRLERLVKLRNEQVEARWIIAGHYGDVLRTASATLPPELARLLKDIEDGRINCIVIRSVEQITQSIDSRWLLINQLEAKGVSIICEEYPQ